MNGNCLFPTAVLASLGGEDTGSKKVGARQFGSYSYLAQWREHRSCLIFVRHQGSVFPEMQGLSSSRCIFDSFLQQTMHEYRDKPSSGETSAATIRQSVSRGASSVEKSLRRRGESLKSARQTRQKELVIVGSSIAQPRGPQKQNRIIIKGTALVAQTLTQSRSARGGESGFSEARRYCTTCANFTVTEVFGRSLGRLRKCIRDLATSLIVGFSLKNGREKSYRTRVRAFNIPLNPNCDFLK